MEKKTARLRRSRKARARISELQAARLTVHRSNSHIYAQIIDSTGSKVLTSASTTEADLRKALSSCASVAAAQAVGKRIAEKAKGLGVEKVAFDRAGYKYHGRVKALADAARENGLQF